MIDESPKQRLRIKFAKGDALKYISHLDLTRTWERAFRRAGLPVAYSLGFNPRPRFQIAAALPVGVTGRSELMDVWLTEPLDGEEVLSRLRSALPSGLEVSSAAEVDVRGPSLQSQMRAAHYQVVLDTRETAAAILTRVEELLAAPTLPRRRPHKGKWKTYDLRPLIQSVVVEAVGDAKPTITMRLQASPEGAGRPDEVLDALGLMLTPHTTERTTLHFEFDK